MFSTSLNQAESTSPERVKVTSASKDPVYQQQLHHLRVAVGLGAVQPRSPHLSGTRLLEAGSSGHAPEFPLQLEPLLSAVVVAGASVSSVSANP